MGGTGRLPCWSYSISLLKWYEQGRKARNKQAPPAAYLAPGETVKAVKDEGTRRQIKRAKQIAAVGPKARTNGMNGKGKRRASENISDSAEADYEGEDSGLTAARA